MIPDPLPPRPPASAATIRPLQRADIPAMSDLNLRNRVDLDRTGPPRTDESYLPAAQALRFEALIAQCETGARRYWVIEVDGVVAGDIGLHAIHRGHVQSANVGYLVDSAVRGRGVATTALRLVIAEAFGVLGLHRLDAGAMTSNLASQKVLEKAGFSRVGINRRFLYVDGAWRDHVLYEIVGPDFVPAAE